MRPILDLEFKGKSLINGKNYSMKKVQLRQTATVSLHTTYARSMGGNKIKHYTIGLASSLIGMFTGEKPDTLQCVKEEIELEEGEKVEIELLASGYDLAKDKMRSVGGMMIEDAADAVLKDYPEIRKSLEQRKIQGCLHQYNECSDPWKAKWLTPITGFINYWTIGKINSLLYKFQSPNLQDLKDGMDRFEYLNEVNNIKLLPTLPMWGMVRKVTPCQYLTVAFEEDEVEAATASLINDLKILNDKELIMGHLALPSMILLADTIGSGKKTCALFCFLFVDMDKLMKLTNVDGPLNMPKKPLRLLGVKNECFEGEINFLNGVDPRSKYEIEEVFVVGGMSAEKAHKVQVDNYNETVGFVNEVAKKAREDLQKIKKVSSNSETRGGQVHVNVTVEGDPEVIARLKKSTTNNDNL